MCEGAARAGRRDVASQFIATTLNTVYDVMDKRGREPNLPLPGNSYECWDTASMDKSLPKVSNYAMAEAYGWSSIATVLLLRTIVGFRDGTGLPSATAAGPPAFELAPALPRELLLPSVLGKVDEGGCRQRSFGVERLGFRRRLFSVVYRYKACRGTDHAVDGDETVPAVPLVVEIREAGLDRPRAAFEAVNGRRYTVTAHKVGSWAVADI